MGKKKKGFVKIGAEYVQTKVDDLEKRLNNHKTKRERQAEEKAANAQNAEKSRKVHRRSYPFASL